LVGVRKELMFAVIAAALSLGLASCLIQQTNPFSKYDICFDRDQPGATDRHVTYTPVKCSDPTVVLGQTMGGEYAILSFYDVDADSFPEYVISSEFWCRWGFEPCVHPTYTAVRVQPGNPPAFAVIETRNLPHLKD